MAGKATDLTGQRFGRLYVIQREGSRNNRAFWLCKCDCGKTTIVDTCSLRRKNRATTSCGCFNREQLLKSHITHGQSKSKMFSVWHDIKKRCLNPNIKTYKYYGGRGIKMYSEWINDYMAFYNYVSTLPHFGVPGLSIDRINNDGNYEPGNLRWATAKEQMNNRRK